jgi:protein-disulfide isomerase
MAYLAYLSNMLKTHKVLLILLPAILIATLALFVRFIQYRPLIPKELRDRAQNQTQQTGINIPLYSDDPIVGNKKAPTTLIIFSDFGCEHCRALSVTLDELLAKYPDKIKIIWKGLSVTKFPYSTETALRYAFCANRHEKFAEFAKFAYANYNQLTSQTLKSIVTNVGLNEKKLNDCLSLAEIEDYNKRNELLGMALNIQIVPTIFFNNKQINPPADLAGWEAVLGL